MTAPMTCTSSFEGAGVGILAVTNRDSGRTAEDYLAAEHAPPPDCLVLDIRLGALSRFDLYDRLRAAGLSIPTIFITGHDDAATRERARNLGSRTKVR